MIAEVCMNIKKKTKHDHNNPITTSQQTNTENLRVEVGGYNGEGKEGYNAKLMLFFHLIFSCSLFQLNWRFDFLIIIGIGYPIQFIMFCVVLPFFFFFF